MDNILKKILFVLGIIGTVYHLYLVVHPYTPLSNYPISILSLTQVQRATHVFLVALLGYMVSMIKSKKTGIWFGVIFTIMMGISLIEFLKFDMPIHLKMLTILIWIVTVLPSVFPVIGKPSSAVCALLSFMPFLYLVINYESLIYRAIMPESWDLVMAYCEVLLILGVIFRLSGPIMPVFVMFFLIYNLYGDRIPGIFSNPGFSFDMLLGKMYCETEAGIYGSITGVSLKYLIYFTTLGAIVTNLNFGKIIANIALLLVGRSPASPGRATSFMAVLMGMFSGSGAADTQFVATLTKPLYEKVGYNNLVAAGIIATVGSIAYITPPVMGSISFLMVELLSIPYSWIIGMAIGPMILYLFGIMVYNELYVKKMNLPPLEISSEVDISYLKRYSYVFIPIIFIIVLIYRGYSINITVTLAAVLFVIFAYVDKANRPPIKNLFQSLSEGIISLLPIASAVIAANMIMSMMVMSGLASKFSLFLMNISGSSILLATLFTGMFSLILGMGVPPVATYVLTSALTAPTIQKLAIINGIPEEAALLATHMFLFYYAVLAEVTPPVALSAYAASAVMGTDPIKTGVFAARVAIPKYLIGLTFILSFSGTAILVVPMIQTLPIGQALIQIIPRFIMTILAIFYLNVAVVGYFKRILFSLERYIIGTCSVLLFYPSMKLNLIAGGISTFFIVKIFIEKGKI